MTTRRNFLELSLCLGIAGSILHARPLWAGALQKKPSSDSRLIVLDPGHGGHDPGALGGSGMDEKNIVLDLAQRMAETISRQRGVRVILTRDSDIFVPLPERVAVATRANADLLVSVHADSAPNKAARGISAYTLSEKASDDFTRDLAERENKAGLLPHDIAPTMDPEVTAILLDLAARRSRNVSLRAKAGLIRRLTTRWPLLERPMRSANFAVLRSGRIPSILLESGFLSNPQDSTILSTRDSRRRLAHMLGEELGLLIRSPLFA